MSPPSAEEEGNPRRAALAAAAFALVILGLTLFPTRNGAVPSGCFLCVERSLADAFANLALFLPLGAALVAAGMSWWKAVALSAALSLGIEAAQFRVVTGRDANPDDLLFNSLGAAIGAALWAVRRRLFHPTRAAAARLSLAAGIAAAAVMAAVGPLASLDVPGEALYGQWSKTVGSGRGYTGTVLGASLGPVPIPVDRLDDPARVGDLLLGGDTLRVHLRAGEPSGRRAQVFALADDRGNLLVFLGVQHDDLWVRFQTVAASLKLERASYLVRDALRGVRPGDEATIRLWKSGAEHCVAVGQATTCGLGYTPGSGWSLLRALSFLPAGMLTAVGALWLAALFFPLGYWSRRSRESLVGGVAAAAALLVLPPFVGLLPAAPLEVAGALLGLALGIAAQRRVARADPVPAGRRTAGTRPEARAGDERHRAGRRKGAGLRPV